MRFTVHVTNAHDKGCLVDITKASITGKAILTESELESVQSLRRNSTWLFTARNNSVYGFHVRTYIKQTLFRIYTNKLKQLCKQHTVLLYMLQLLLGLIVSWYLTLFKIAGHSLLPILLLKIKKFY